MGVHLHLIKIWGQPYLSEISEHKNIYKKKKEKKNPHVGRQNIVVQIYILILNWLNKTDLETCDDSKKMSGFIEEQSCRLNSWTPKYKKYNNKKTLNIALFTFILSCLYKCHYTPPTHTADFFFLQRSVLQPYSQTAI